MFLFPSADYLEFPTIFAMKCPRYLRAQNPTVLTEKSMKKMTKFQISEKKSQNFQISTFRFTLHNL